MPPADLTKINRPKLVHFYFPLDEPLRVMTEIAFTSILDDIDKDKFDPELPIYLFPEGPEGFPSIDNPKNFVSLKFHQASYQKLSDAHFKNLYVDLLLDILGVDKMPEDGEKYFEKFKSEHYQTIVEAVTILEDEDEFVRDSLPKTFKNCIEELFKFVKSSQVVSYYPYNLSYENLHPIIVYTRTTFDNEFIDRNTFFLVSGKLPTEPPIITEEDMLSITHGIVRYNANDSVLDYLEYKNEGNIALTKNGNYSDACVKFAIAAEILLSSILSMAIWEEVHSSSSKTTEEDAIKILAEYSLSMRARKQYSGRFGGKWEDVRNKWEDNIASPRHMVVHLGRRMDIEAAYKSRETLYELEKYLSDRLTEKIDKFPKTAWIFVGQAGFKSRNVLQRAEKIISKVEPDLREHGNVTNWLDEYHGWRIKIDPLIKAENLRRKPSPETIIVQNAIKIAKRIEYFVSNLENVYEKTKYKVNDIFKKA